MIAKEVVMNTKEMDKEMEKDEEILRKKFDHDLKIIIEKFLMKHFGKDFNSDLFRELYSEITYLLLEFDARPQL